jgi:DeoR/GlpR family transcriptional regulator of sugar metabolism
MKSEDRHLLIGELLRYRNEVTVDELMAECGASGATIRRDLETLSANGVLRRIHGGAKSLVLRGENPGYGQRELEQQGAKSRIAAAVAALLADREHVWLDSGTTATEIARKLRHRNLTVMPMSLRAVNVLTADNQPEGHQPALLLPGGSLIPGELSLRGPLAEASIRTLRFDTAVVTPCSVSLKDGLLAHDLEDAAVKRAGLESAGRVVLACSGSKWNTSAVALVAPMHAVDVIVTDRSFSPAELDQLGQISVKVVNV